MKMSDIDECSANNRVCGTDAAVAGCNNTVGSYTCQCNRGYNVSADGTKCEGN